MLSIVTNTVGRKCMKIFLLFAVGLMFALWPTANAQTYAAQSTTARPEEGVSGKLPQFEVATIKPIDPKVMHIVGVNIYPGGRVVISVATLKSLIELAFRLSYWQISGGDPWTENDCYDLEAKPPENLQSSITNLRQSLFEIEDENLRKMLQALLIDRFQLRFHRETKTGKVYLLERNGKTLRLRPTKVMSDSASASSFTNRPKITESSGDVGFAGGRWVIFNTSMPQLAKFAADHIVLTPVLDRTELSGSFDYWQPTRLTDSEAQYENPSDSFRLLIPEVGLRLRPAQGPVEILVIEHAEKPSPN